MTGEINGDFYCQFWERPKEQCKAYAEYGEEMCVSDGKRACFFCRHKWPTPEQFREEHGGDYQKDGAIYYLEKGFAFAGWNTTELWTLEKESSEDYLIVCACTRNKPDKGWKPGMTEAKVQ